MPWFDVLVSLLLATTLVIALVGGGIVDFLLLAGTFSLVMAAVNLYGMRLAKESPRSRSTASSHPCATPTS
jgi:hypothetical protein